MERLIEVCLKWIPVTERLPEEHDSIFAKLKGTEKWINDVLIAFRSAKVIAWMPFPEPYEGERK